MSEAELLALSVLARGEREAEDARAILEAFGRGLMEGLRGLIKMCRREHKEGISLELLEVIAVRAERGEWPPDLRVRQIPEVTP